MKNQHVDLLCFRNDIADGLLARSKQQASSRGRGRPTLCQNEESSTNAMTLKRKRQATPTNSVRYDGYQHWPEHMTNKGRCKVEGCKGQTRFKCSKCNIFLCIPNGSRNCFKEYHHVK